MLKQIKIFALILAFVVYFADHYTKGLILDMFITSRSAIEVTSFCNLILVWNKGVSFGLFAYDEVLVSYLLSAIVAVIALIMMVWLYRARDWITSMALGLIIGGAFGNLHDRLQYGAVIDFLDFHVVNLHWPAFNLADAAICLGIFMLLLQNFIFHDTKV